jgi:hypothetical protein
LRLNQEKLLHQRVWFAEWSKKIRTGSEKSLQDRVSREKLLQRVELSGVAGVAGIAGIAGIANYEL